MSGTGDAGAALVGVTATLTSPVGPDDTAAAVGSGDVPVLATPRLVAWAEAATVAAVADHLSPGTTTVGTRVELDHLAASGVGTRIAVTARVVAVDGRAVRFDVTALDADRVVARGVVQRVVVDRDRFLGRL